MYRKSKKGVFWVLSKQSALIGEDMYIPQKIRVSIGTAALLNLKKIKLNANPTTAYFMTYFDKKCTANCGFCTQARESTSDADMLSRIYWPPYDIKIVLDRLKKHIEKERILRRICLQTINVPELDDYISFFLTKIREYKIEIPISIAIHATNKEKYIRYKELGVSEIGISIDTATPELFEKIKGFGVGNSYTWDKYIDALKNAVEIFGIGHVSTHLIIGLGETEKEAIKFIQDMYDMGVSVGLFAFTPMKGTLLEYQKPPDIRKYRRVQLARYLITNRLSFFDRMAFSTDGKITDFGIDETRLIEIIRKGVPFLTSGCKDCNRPFYNEIPRKELFNYPFIPSDSQIEKILYEILER